jgi:CRP-like cAMP-binding protein
MGHLIDHIEHHKVIDKGCSTPTEEKNSKLNDERRRASALSAAAAISGRTPKLSHMLALHPEHEALHHALQLCSFVKSEEDADLTESRRGSIDTLKKTAYSSMFNSIVDAIQPRKQFHLRVVTKGQMLGILGLLKVYGRNLETAKCIGPVECYAINNEAFFKIFEKNPEIIERLRERVTENHFQMMPHEHAPTKYGIPLFRHSPEDIEKREGVWLKNIMKKEREMASRVRRDAGIVLTPKDSVGSIHENWSASYMPEEPQEEDDKNKISTIDSLDKSIDIPVDPQKSEGDRKVNWVRAVSSETGETTKT